MSFYWFSSTLWTSAGYGFHESYWLFNRDSYKGVSKNTGTPKWMVYNGKILLTWMIWLGVPLFSETPIMVYYSPIQLGGMSSPIYPKQSIFLFHCSPRFFVKDTIKTKFGSNILSCHAHVVVVKSTPQQWSKPLWHSSILVNYWWSLELEWLILILPIPNAQCMAYLPTFTINFRRNVGKHTIHWASGYRSRCYNPLSISKLPGFFVVAHPSGSIERVTPQPPVLPSMITKKILTKLQGGQIRSFEMEF